ncbi:MAG: hypothetical protein E7357_03555 [Clostridiales bacterium]|nr:hypothetical protein [Clostridiales bacterium]
MIKKIIASLILVCSLFSFSGCTLIMDLFVATIGSKEDPYGKADPSDYPEYPDYQSAYTEEEHIERLTKITESGAWKDIDAELGMAITIGNVVSIDVETVYAFYDGDPEFFLITITMDCAIERPSVWGTNVVSDKGFVLGYILNDEYYVLSLYTGEDPWTIQGYGEYKKYFGSYSYAVEIDGEIRVLCLQRTKQQYEIYFAFFEPYSIDEETEFRGMQFNYLAYGAQKYVIKGNDA